MADEWFCEVKIARRNFIKVGFLALCAIAYAVAYIPMAIDQLLAGNLNGLKPFFFVGILFLVFCVGFLRAKWRIRVNASTLHLRRCWGWEKYRFADIELDAAWKKRLADPDETWRWVEDQSAIVLHFIGGRIVKLPCEFYSPPYELKIALLRALSPNESVVLENAAAFREHLALPRPFNIENALFRTVPLVIFSLHVMLIFGIGGIIGILASDKTGMAFIVICAAPLRFLGSYFWRLLETAIAKHQKKVGYYFKGLAIVSGVVGMSMILLMNPEKADMSEWVRNILLPAAILFWLLGAATFIAGDVLVRRGRKAEQQATR